MTTVRSSIARNLDKSILQSCLPLFITEKVQAIEWAFDSLFCHDALPDWFDEYEKRLKYFKFPSLLAYVMISQTNHRTEVRERTADFWKF